MATRSIVLTNTPQLITSGSAYIQAKGGVFNFKFSSTEPTSVEDCHTDTNLYYDGSLGALYVWKNSFQTVTLIVSEAT